MALHGTDLSLMIFTKAAHPLTIRRWTEHFALIDRKTDFLFCLFFHVLIDQSLHFTGQGGSLELLRDWSGELSEPRLRGILATAHSDISPFLLLVAAALWADSESDADRKLVAYSSLFRDRCEYLGLPYDVLITEAIAERRVLSPKITAQELIRHILKAGHQICSCLNRGGLLLGMASLKRAKGIVEQR